MLSSKSKSRQKLKAPLVDSQDPTLFVFDAIGTQWTIEIFQTLDEASKVGLSTAIAERIEEFDKHYSRFRTDSLVTRIAQKAGTYILPSDAQPMFDLYRKLYDITDGKVTPLIGSLLNDTGYDASYSLQPKEIHEVAEWDEVLKYNFPKLKTTRPVLLDFGAAGKGYLVDIVGGLLRSHSVQHFCINAGGDILVSNPPQDGLPIALEHPGDTSMAIGVATLTEGSLCGSSGNRRAWADYHHIMDPDQLTSPKHIQALWVYADDAMLADALSTCLFFVDPKKLAKHFAFEYAIVRRDNSLVRSSHFPATFFDKNTKDL
jgi:thiamine biosynthesis lipoprotein